MDETKEVNIVSFSGGKDSTAMLIMMLERGMKVDEIIFLDTGVEFPAMYDHIKQVEEYTGREITKLKEPKGFEYYLYTYKKVRGKYMGEPGFGYPHMINRWCTARLKTRIYDKYLREKYKGYKINSYIGIAYDERERERERKSIH